MNSLSYEQCCERQKNKFVATNTDYLWLYLPALAIEILDAV